MIWVRNPWWDGFWLLSGLPLAAAFTVLTTIGVSPYMILAVGVIALQTAHSISPIALAWSHSGFRSLMLKRPQQFVWVPIALIVASAIVGSISQVWWPAPIFDPITLKLLSARDYLDPLYAFGVIYAYWNIYHLGKQNFGVMALYRRLAGGGASRRADLVFCTTIAWAVMLVPALHFVAYTLQTPIIAHYGVQHAHDWITYSFYVIKYTYIIIAIVFALYMLYLERASGVFCFPRLALIVTNSIVMGAAMFFQPMIVLGIISYNHWLTAIGLAGHVNRRAVLFPIIMVFAGVALFGLLFIPFSMVVTTSTPNGEWRILLQVAAVAVAFRLALGNVHFLYDRWVWKLSDPQVRATIGKELFA